jgi:predicted MFS family arabinose efflux permease
MANMSSSEIPKLYSPPFIAFGFANFFTVSSFGIFFLFPLFIKSRGGLESDIGIVMGVFSLSSVLCRPWISGMIDRIGRKISYTIGSLIMTLLPLAYLLFQGGLSSFYTSVIPVRVIHGVGLALCFTAAFTYTADIIPGARLNEGLGMLGVTGLMGLAMGPVIGEMIIERFGFSLFFVAASAVASLGLIIHLPLQESIKHGSRSDLPSFFSLLVKRHIFPVAIIAFIFGIGLAATENFISPFAKEREVTFISLYYICYSSAAVSTRLLGGRLADRIGENRIIPYALLIAGSGLLVLIFLKGRTILAVSGVLSGCGQGFLFPCLNSLLVRNEPAVIRGKITGVFTGGIDAGAFAGSLMLGYIGELWGFQALFLAAGLALLLGLGIHRFHVKRKRNSP